MPGVRQAIQLDQSNLPQADPLWSTDEHDRLFTKAMRRAWARNTGPQHNVIFQIWFTEKVRRNLQEHAHMWKAVTESKMELIKLSCRTAFKA